MAANTGGNFFVSSFKQPTMDACRVLFLLIHTQGWVEFLHEVGVVVTLPAEGWYVRRSGPAQITLARILSGYLVVLCRIPAMAIVAGKPPRKVDVVVD
jgi:hypothetical protein